MVLSVHFHNLEMAVFSVYKLRDRHTERKCKSKKKGAGQKGKSDVGIGFVKLFSKAAFLCQAMF